jgi:hypothetical protein
MLKERTEWQRYGEWYDKVFAVAALIRLHLKVSDYDSILYADYWLRAQ